MLMVGRWGRSMNLCERRPARLLRVRLEMVEPEGGYER